MSSKRKNDQKAERAPAQKTAAQDAKSAAARAARIASHNNWPAVSLTAAEEEFSALIGEKPGTALLKPYVFKDVNDGDFHRHLGMLIDGLEMLPKRPDHAFDFFFRTVDELSQQLTKQNKITDAMESLGPWVCNSLSSNAVWKSFINIFAGRVPTKTSKFMAQRLLDAFDNPKDPIRPRAEKLLGKTRYAEFHEKFRGGLSSAEKAQGANNAAIFLQRLISQREASPSQHASPSFATLDLAVVKNVFDESKALWALVSLMAFTSRNERFHGSSLSPFRSSKADKSLYASYYFQMLFVYTLAVGLMIELFPGCGDATNWIDGMQANVLLLEEFFGSSIK